jgi:hypothetical protein
MTTLVAKRGVALSTGRSIDVGARYAASWRSGNQGVGSTGPSDPPVPAVRRP